MKEEKWSRKEMIELILTIAGLAVAIIFGFIQHNISIAQTQISDTQTKILNLSSAPREATIEIIPPEKIKISAMRLARSKENEVFEEISFLNFGTMGSNYV